MKLNKKQHLLDRIGLVLIGLYSLGYVLFYKFFAEKHIQFPFLDFPIFVGEMLFFVCLLLFFAKYWRNLPRFTKWHYVIMGYFVFVLGKALVGYLNWGPLALRHAALFYYPVFAVFSYAFYRRKFLSSKIMLFLTFLIISVFIYGRFYGYWTLTLVFLGFILIKSYPHMGIKVLLFLALFIFIPYREFFSTSRMMIVSNFVAGMYLVSMLPLVLKGKKKFKFAIVTIVGVMILLGFFKFSDHNAVKSIGSFKKIAKAFNSAEKAIIANVNSGLEMVEQREAKLYQPEGKVEVRSVVTNGQMKEEGQQIASNEQMSEEVRAIIIEQTKKEINKIFANKPMSEEVRAIIIEQTIKEMGKDKVLVEQIEKGGLGREILKKKIIENIRIVVVTYEDMPANLKVETDSYVGNAAFRLFIWRDMIVELMKERPVMGFDFGKPLRSRSLELTLMGFGDWSRDGWIGAHNSHLHIIYRAGIIGVVFIFSLLTILFRMIKKFVALKSLTGILLCGIIINWFVAANFLLTLELPYTAIPIWTLFGLTYAYCYKNEA